MNPGCAGLLDIVLPAHAGMIPERRGRITTSLRAPRTCGDDPYSLPLNLSDLECSPHMRG